MGSSTLERAPRQVITLRVRHRCCLAVEATFLALLLGSCGNPADNGSPADLPHAGFSATCTDVTCSFSDESFDADGTIVGRAWDFGDGATSADVNPEHTYP